MKKSILIIFLALLTTVSFAQLSFGPKLGVNISKLSTDFDEDLDAVMDATKAGVQLGAYVRVGSKVYVQPELLFSIRGGQTGYYNQAKELVQGDYKMSAIDIPVLVGVKALNLPLVKVRAYAGPVASFVISKNFSVNDVEQSINDLNPKDAVWSATLGAGVDVLMLTFDVRYEMGLNNISGLDGTTLKNNMFNVSVGWKIF
jgi:hypothetical protein